MTTLFGDWDRARRLTSGGLARLTAAIERAVLYEGQMLRKEIIMVIRRQENFKPLSPWTLAARRLKRKRASTKALIDNGDLVGSINVVKVLSDQVFVGIPRAARSKANKDLVNIGKIHEYGTDPFILPVSDGMSRYLGLLIGKMRKKEIASLNNGNGVGSGAVVVQIPARPFLRPAFERWSKGVKQRLLKRIAKNMGWI